MGFGEISPTSITEDFPETKIFCNRYLYVKMHCLHVELDENSFLIVGMMCSVSVHTKTGDHRKADFIRKEAGTYRDGQWRCR